MMKWMDYLNAMYAEHPYTDAGRVAVEYCPELGIVVVKVLGRYAVIELDGYNELGALYAVQDMVRKMYDGKIENCLQELYYNRAFTSVD